jgi:chromosome segregation ATPase
MTSLTPDNPWRWTLLKALYLSLPMAAVFFAVATWPLIRAERAERERRALQAALGAMQLERDDAKTQRDEIKAQRDEARAGLMVKQRERDEARVDLVVKQRERDEARADLAVQQRERDEVRISLNTMQHERDEVRVSLTKMPHERDEARAQRDRARLLFLKNNQALQGQIRHSLAMLDDLEKQLEWSPSSGQRLTEARGMSPANFGLFDPQPIPPLSTDQRPKRLSAVLLAAGPVADLMNQIQDDERWIGVLTGERETLAEKLRNANDRITRTNAVVRLAHEAMRRQSGALLEGQDRIRSAHASIQRLRSQLSELLKQVGREREELEASVAMSR